MVTVPIIEQDVRTAPLPTTNIPYQSRTNDNSGMNAVAKSLSDFAVQAKQEGDTVALLDAQKKMNDWEQENLFKPQTGAFDQKGKNALNLPQTVGKNFDDFVGQVNEGLANTDQQLMFQKMAESRQAQVMSQLYSHERQQMDIYGKEVTQGNIDSNITQAENNSNNPDLYQKYVEDAANAYRAYGATQGEPEQFIESKALDIKQKGLIQVFGSQASKNADGFLTAVKDARDIETLKTDLNAARGVRNNNPGNLRGDDPWQGKVGADQGGYLQFASAKDGLRALAINLKNQQDVHGLNTINDIVEKYAPVQDNNDVEAYKITLSQIMGVKAGDKLNLSDPKTLSQLMEGIILHENGGQPYGKPSIDAAADAAVTGKKTEEIQVADATGLTVPTEAVTKEPVKTPLPGFDLLTWQQQKQVINAAETSLRQQQVGARSDLEARVKDTIAMTQSGTADPNPPQYNDFVRAYGRDEGAQKFQQYSQIFALSTAINDVATQTDAQAMQTLEMNKPKAGPGFAAQQQKYETLMKAVDTARKTRAEDPQAFAMARGMAPNEPLSFGNMTQLTAQLQTRASTAKTMTSTYGTPLQLFTNGEAKAFSKALEEMPVNNKLAYLGNFRDSLNDPRLYQAALQQIRPDSPVTAMAGLYLGLERPLPGETHWYKANDAAITPYNVASHLIEGEALLNPTKSGKETDGKGKPMPMPPDGTDASSNGLRITFNGYTGDSFRGQPLLAEQAYQAYRAYYAAEAATQGDYSGVLNADIAALSAKAVIGSVVDMNGKHVRAPWGMDATAFNDLANISVESKIKEAGLDPSKINWGNIKLENTGEPGKYRMSVGNGYLIDKDNQPLTIDISRDAFADQMKRDLALVGDRKTNLNTDDEFLARGRLDRLNAAFGAQ